MKEDNQTPQSWIESQQERARENLKREEIESFFDLPSYNPEAYKNQPKSQIVDSQPILPPSLQRTY